MRPVAILATLLSLLTPLFAAGDRNQTQNIVYAAKAFKSNGGPVINIKNSALFSPNAVGDGITDDTAAFVSVFNYLADQAGRNLAWNSKTDPRITIYLPTGTYLVSDRLVHSGSVNSGFNFLRLVGQNRNDTVIKLKNNSAGYGAGLKKEVLCFTKYWEGYNGGSKWGNILRNITIDTGTGNPGAIGVSFFAANAGSIDNLTVRSGDGAGFAGVYFPGWSVQGHFMDITVNGFNEGIRTEVVIENNPVFEHVTVLNQLVAGLSLGRAAASVRKLKSTNTVPAVTVWGDGAHTVLLDSQLSGGSPANPAIRLVDSTRQQLFVRNVSISGYGTSIQKDGVAVSTAAYIPEWKSGQVFRNGTSTPDRSMNLPVEDFPLKTRDPDLNQWVCPDDFAGPSDAAKIQAALNSGKPNIYFPRYHFSPQATVLTVPATVKHLDFMSQESWLWGGLRIDQASPDPLYIEGSGRKQLVIVNAQRTVAARSGSLHFNVQTSLPVTAHFSNIATMANGHTSQFCPPNATIYARNINEESWSNTNFVVNGGKLWVMGFKTESDQTAFHVKNGGFLEVLGGYVNFAGQSATQRPDVLNEESNVSYIGTNFMFRTHWEGIHEIRNGVLTKFLNGVFPPRITGHGNNYFVPLYSGYDPSLVPVVAVLHETFDADSAVTSQATFESRFLVNTVSGNKWWLNGTTGTGNSGGINAPAGQNTSVVHRTPVPGFGANSMLVQMMDTFVSYRTSNEPAFGIGWSNYLKPNLSAGSDGLVVRLDYIPPSGRTSQNPERFRLVANDVVIGTPGFSPNQWYRWETVWTRSGSNTFSVSVTLFGLGSSGTGAPVNLGSFTRNNITSSTMANASQVYSGIQGRARDGTGVFRVDYWTVGY